jgi:hypothetical protein
MGLKAGRNLLLLLALPGAVSCHHESGEGSAASGPIAAAAPFAIQEVRLGVGVEAGPRARLTPLTTRDPVTAVLVTTGSPNGVQLAARLLCLMTGKDVGPIAMRLDGKAAVTPVVLRFPAAADQVPGRYTLEIRLNGKLAAKRYFDVAPATPDGTRITSTTHRDG